MSVPSAEHVRDDPETEAVLAVLAAGFRAPESLGYHDRAMVRGRALARLRKAHPQEFERYFRLETSLLITSGKERG